MKFRCKESRINIIKTLKKLNFGESDGENNEF